MEITKPFWWLKQPLGECEVVHNDIPVSDGKDSSMAEFLQKERDVDTILDEIKAVSFQSPLHTAESVVQAPRCLGDILLEVERLNEKSSKSLGEINAKVLSTGNDLNKDSEAAGTISALCSPLPLDEPALHEDRDKHTYTDDFCDEILSSGLEELTVDEHTGNEGTFRAKRKYNGSNQVDSTVDARASGDYLRTSPPYDGAQNAIANNDVEENYLSNNNQRMLHDIQNRWAHNVTLCDAQLLQQWERTLEELKDIQERNTALQIQLNATTNNNCRLKCNVDELIIKNETLERRTLETGSLYERTKHELDLLRQQLEIAHSTSEQLTNQLESERTATREARSQIERDAIRILDLDRQLKELERIRSTCRHSAESVMTLTSGDKSIPALEARICTLQVEAQQRQLREKQVLADIEKKFNEMRNKYETHIALLEKQLHVSVQKNKPLRPHSADKFDVYTQTLPLNWSMVESAISRRNVYVQTTTACRTYSLAAAAAAKKVSEESHLLTTVRGLQAELNNKHKIITKVQKELDDVKRTNKRLQREREFNLKTNNDLQLQRKGSQTTSINHAHTSNLGEEVHQLRNERDKLKCDLNRIELDYQTLKTKRLEDLNTLAEAHDREITTYISNITPLKEQLELQRISMETLQAELIETKGELAIVTVERDHLGSQKLTTGNSNQEIVALQHKIDVLEQRYTEREKRLKAIVQGLAQKNVANQNCRQCAQRQKQLIEYKLELDHILASVKALK